MTLLLTRSDVISLMDPQAALSTLRSAFADYSCNRTIDAQRARSPLPGPGSAMILFPGLISGIPAYTVKVHAKYPGEAPPIRGVLHLHDLSTGALLALMDSTYLTEVRTGLAGALAAEVLANAGARRVAIVGAGVQGSIQARLLPLVRPVESITVYDTVPERASAAASRWRQSLGLPVTACGSVGEAVADAEIIVTATWSRQPFLFAGMVKPGAHITTLGPDEPGKCEVDAGLIRDSLFICDDRRLAVTMGAIGGASLDAGQIHAELGEILAGQATGRTSVDQRTVYGGVGLAFQDLALAWQVYQAALERGVGHRVNFTC